MSGVIRVRPLSITSHPPPSPSTVDLSMHLLPCRVECEGGGEEGCAPARVEDYFTPTIRKEREGREGAVYSASFRGRPLKGIQLAIPQGYEGVVLTEPSTLGSEEREVEVKGQFSHLHYWNLQNDPTGDDKLVQAMVWTQLAQTLHTPTPLAKTDETTNLTSKSN